MYRVVVHRRAARYLQRLPQLQKERIKDVLATLALDPFHGPDVRPMVGQWAGYYRLRIGDERIIFWVEKQEVTMWITSVRVGTSTSDRKRLVASVLGCF